MLPLAGGQLRISMVRLSLPHGSAVARAGGSLSGVTPATCWVSTAGGVVGWTPDKSAWPLGSKCDCIKPLSEIPVDL